MAWDDTKVATDDLLSGDWNDMVTDQKLRGIPGEENKRGSDLTGSNGATGRVLTLANTTLTKTAGMMAIRNGAFIPKNDLTIVHNASGSTITFTNTAIFETDFIDVFYFT